MDMEDETELIYETPGAATARHPSKATHGRAPPKRMPSTAAPQTIEAPAKERPPKERRRIVRVKKRPERYMSNYEIPSSLNNILEVPEEALQREREQEPRVLIRPREQVIAIQPPSTARTGIGIKTLIFILTSLAMMFVLATVMSSQFAKILFAPVNGITDDDILVNTTKKQRFNNPDMVRLPTIDNFGINNSSNKAHSNGEENRHYAPQVRRRKRNNTDEYSSGNSKCTTPACIQQGAKLIEETDTTHRPCDDFYQYVCSNWIERQPKEVPKNVHSVDSVLIDKYSELLIDSIRSDSNPFPELRYLYDECVLPQPNLFINLREMLFRKVQLHFWPFTPKMDITDEEVSLQLGRIFDEFGITPLFDFKITSFGAFAIDKPSNTILKNFLGANVKAPDRIVQNLYNIIKNATRSKRAGKLDTNMTEVELRIRKALQETQIPTMDQSKLINCTSRQKQDMKPMGYINIQKLLEAALGNVTIKPSDFIRLPAATFLESLGKNLPIKADLLNYAAFQIMLAISPLFTNESVRTTLGSVAFGKYPEFVDALKISQICLRMIEKFDPTLPPYVFYENAVKFLGGRAIIEELLTSLRASFQVSLKQWLGLSSEFREKFAMKMRNITWEALMPSFLQEVTVRDDYVDGLYTNNPMNPLPHFMYFWIRTAGKRFRQALFGHQPRWFGGFLTSQARLEPAYKQLEIPFPVFDFDLNNDSSVTHLHIPRVGYRIYLELYKYLYHEAINYDLAKKGRELENYLTEIRRCIAKDLASISWAPFPATLNSEKSSLSALLDFMAAKSALDAYLAVMERNQNKDFRLASAPGFSGVQLFFIYYARSHCDSSNPKWSAKQMQHGTETIAWFKVNGVLRHIPEFSDAFGCPANSRMNPSKRCI